MNSRHSIACLTGLVFLAVPAGFSAEEAAPAKPSASIPFASRFKLTRERIDVLYRNRNETPPPPDPRHNPFRDPGSAVAAARPGESSDAKPGPVAPTSKLTRLQQAVAALKVSGVFEVSGRTYCVINGRPYKPGAVVQTRVDGEPVLLRVGEVSGRVVTLALDEAEMTLKF